ncbi:M15 family metallopeptidase [Spongiivirga citrea]|uniref:D-alanyl-D-alanine carboxypeptidase family protein n=1 Tax=Spongiivirga citrea TaxID=1481457 RepID=A0A6M0CL28_9FLAO|nr:M15 family metallopeptidase [Spongiivirga citrea]NER18618.1 D-alanyl-D-alanine carboxypeptidase family protein [Spongiivirga citrea]
MQRRFFIKSTSFAVIGLFSLPVYSLELDKYSREELIGKGNPTLFGDGFLLRKEAYEAYMKMCKAALKDGIEIKAVSSYRNYDHQNRIWTRKYNRFTKEGLSPIRAIRKIVEYSTIPGTSRHHWGTDIDIIDGSKKVEGDVLVASKFHGNGPFCKLREWLDKHSLEFGFHTVYTSNANRKGFKYEPWHLSYAAISRPMLKQYRKLDVKSMLQQEKLIGSEHFTADFINQYINENILDINPELLK